MKNLQSAIIKFVLVFAALIAFGVSWKYDDIRHAAIATTSADSAPPPVALARGEWVAITSGVGKSGKQSASSWYLLRFHDNGRARLEWVMPGRYADELVHYRQRGNEITLEGSIDAPQVNGATFMLGEDGTMQARLPGAGGGDLMFYHRSIEWPYVHWLLICAGITITYFAWRQWRWFTPVFMGAGIAALSVYWISTGVDMPIFRWVKNYTLVVTVWIFWLTRYTPLHKYKWMRLLVAMVLVTNIAEAVEVDFHSGYLPNILNGLAGILNILALTRWNAIGPTGRPVKDLVWPGMTMLWLIAYDIWNVTFSYLNFNEYTSNSIALNLMPTLICMIIAGTWEAARGTTLGFFYFYLFCFTTFVMERSFVPIPVGENLALVVGSVSFAINLFVALLVWNWKLFRSVPKWASRLNFGQYKHANHAMTGPDDSINIGLDAVPALADYPPLPSKKKAT